MPVLRKGDVITCLETYTCHRKFGVVAAQRRQDGRGSLGTSRANRSNTNLCTTSTRAATFSTLFHYLRSTKDAGEGPTDNLVKLSERQDGRDCQAKNRPVVNISPLFLSRLSDRKFKTVDITIHHNTMFCGMSC